MVMVRGAQRRRISVSFYLFIGGGSGASELSRSKLLSNFAVCISIAFFVCTFGVVFAVAPSPTGTDRDSGGGTSDGGWRGSTGVTFVLRLLFVAAGTGRDNGGGNFDGGWRGSTDVTFVLRLLFVAAALLFFFFFFAPSRFSFSVLATFA